MSDATTIGYCRACGKALDQASAHNANGTIYCEEHVPAAAGTTLNVARESASQFNTSQFNSAPPPLPAGSHSPYSSSSPPLAFVLGFVPGVGAVYNGQYAKGLIHVVIFGLLISVLANNAAPGFEPLFGMMIPCFVFYMAFEAYHTARKQAQGLPVDEFSGLFASRGEKSRFPIIAVLLIAFGSLFLLSNLDLLDMRRLLRFWPALLIAFGVYLLYERISGQNDRKGD